MGAPIAIDGYLHQIIAVATISKISSPGAHYTPTGWTTCRDIRPFMEIGPKIFLDRGGEVHYDDHGGCINSSSGVRKVGAGTWLSHPSFFDSVSLSSITSSIPPATFPAFPP